MARPKKHNIDTEQLEKLASYGCTNREIASFFNCSESLIKKSYSSFLTKGRDKGKMRLRQMQWLGKQVLGQAEQPQPMEDELAEGFDIEVI